MSVALGPDAWKLAGDKPLEEQAAMAVAGWLGQLTNEARPHLSLHDRQALVDLMLAFGAKRRQAPTALGALRSRVSGDLKIVWGYAGGHGSEERCTIWLAGRELARGHGLEAAASAALDELDARVQMQFPQGPAQPPWRAGPDLGCVRCYKGGGDLWVWPNGTALHRECWVQRHTEADERKTPEAWTAMEQLAFCPHPAPPPPNLDVQFTCSDCGYPLLMDGQRLYPCPKCPPPRPPEEESTDRRWEVVGGVSAGGVVGAGPCSQCGVKTVLYQDFRCTQCLPVGTVVHDDDG